MNMHLQQHPDDERLSALAGADPEALGDSVLREHVGSCHRCRTLVEELGAIRGALAAMPDIAPARPLRLLPTDAGARSDGLGRLARRLFAPVLTAGAALALAGVVGTMGDLGIIGLPAGPGGAAQQAADERDAGAAPEEFAASPLASGVSGADDFGTTAEETGAAEPEPLRASDELAERSPWPMVAFAGAAIAAAAVVLRWILAGRPG